MNNLILIAIFALATSCSTTIEKRKLLLNPIQTDMTAFNTTLRGELIRNEMQGDLSKLNARSYKNYVTQKSDTSEKEYVEFVNNPNTQIAVAAGKKHFAVCIQDRENLIILCDLTSTRASTDFDSDNMNIDIHLKVEELNAKNEK